MTEITSEITLCPACGHVLRHRNVDEDTCDECGLTTPRHTPGRRRRRAAMLTTTDSRSIRDWARANGIEVGSRGVLPWLVVQAYWDAHGTGAEKPAPPPPNPWKPRVARNSDIGWTVHTGGGVTVRVPSWAAGMGLAAAICRRYREGSALLANHGLVDG